MKINLYFLRIFHAEFKHVIRISLSPTVFVFQILKKFKSFKILIIEILFLFHATSTFQIWLWT
jgi:hypothetical protein